MQLKGWQDWMKITPLKLRFKGRETNIFKGSFELRIFKDFFQFQ
jgi:hypothetical protein